MREPTESERKLASVSVELALLSAKYMNGKSNEEIAEWVANQLRNIGYENEPLGANWVYLTGVK